MEIYDLVLGSITTMWVLSLAWGLCTFYTPWAWGRKNHVTIIYAPFCVMTLVFGLFFIISEVWS